VALTAGVDREQIRGAALIAPRFDVVVELLRVAAPGHEPLAAERQADLELVPGHLRLRSVDRLLQHHPGDGPGLVEHQLQAPLAALGPQPVGSLVARDLDRLDRLEGSALLDQLGQHRPDLVLRDGRLHVFVEERVEAGRVARLQELQRPGGDRGDPGRFRLGRAARRRTRRTVGRRCSAPARERQTSQE
jgi:hypothetical protein